MPDNSRIKFGFGFTSTKTGRRITSKLKITRAMKRFLDSDGQENDIDNVHIVAYWSNPEDKNPRSRMRKTTDDPGQSLAGFYSTMPALINHFVEPKVEADLEDIARANQIRRAAPKRPGGRGQKIPPVAKRKTPKGKIRGHDVGQKKKPRGKKSGKVPNGKTRAR